MFENDVTWRGRLYFGFWRKCFAEETVANGGLVCEQRKKINFERWNLSHIWDRARLSNNDSTYFTIIMLARALWVYLSSEQSGTLKVRSHYPLLDYKSFQEEVLRVLGIFSAIKSDFHSQTPEIIKPWIWNILWLSSYECFSHNEKFLLDVTNPRFRRPNFAFSEISNAASSFMQKQIKTHRMWVWRTAFNKHKNRMKHEAIRQIHRNT